MLEKLELFIRCLFLSIDISALKPGRKEEGKEQRSVEDRA